MSKLEVGVSQPKSKSLFWRFRTNVLSYGYAQFITIAAQLVQVPFFLKNWGSVGYGDWLVLTGVPMLLILLDLGFTQASANRATISAGASDWKSTRKSLQTAFLFSFLLGIIVISITCIANYF